MFEAFKKWIWNPIVNGENYNPVNTLFYALLFVALVEIYWRLFAKKIDQRALRKAALPFMIFAGLFRFANARLVPHNFFMITPGIFFVVAVAFTLSYFLLGPKKTQRVGVAATIIMLVLDLSFLRFTKSLYVIPVLLILFFIFKIYSRLEFMKDYVAWTPHIFEAWITSFGVYAGLIEEHVLAGALMQSNPLLFGLIKTLALLVIMYLIKDTGNSQRLYIGTVIGALGIGPGIRDLMELLSL